MNNNNNNISEQIINKIIEINGKGSYIFGICGSTWYEVNKTIQDNINKGLIKYFHSSNESAGINVAAYHASIINKVGYKYKSLLVVVLKLLIINLVQVSSTRGR
jgi:hypothetical protein